jgi:hypothetical protein
VFHFDNNDGFNTVKDASASTKEGNSGMIDGKN